MDPRTNGYTARASRTPASVFGRPLFPILAAVPMVCFAGALVTDLIYARSPEMQWTNFSAWLITAGLVFGFFAAVIAILDFFLSWRSQHSSMANLHIVLTLAAYVIELFNIFVHSRDAYTSVVPTGLLLSAIAVALLVIASWLGAGLPYRHAVGERP